MRQQDEPLEIVSAADDSVYSSALAASKLVGELGADAVFSLDLESNDAGRQLDIEASFGMHEGRRVLVRFGLQVRDAEARAEVSEPALREALGRFGGVGFVNLCVSPAGDTTQELDVTVSATRMRWLSEITFLPLAVESVELRGAYQEILRAFGVEPRVRDARFSLPRYLFSAPPDAQAQAAAFALARRHGLSATLYSAAIPATRALRVAEISSAAGKPAARVEWYLGMGLSGGVVCSEADIDVMQRHLEEQTHARFGGRRWSVRVGPADAPPRAERPRQRVGFTFWIKGNR